MQVISVYKKNNRDECIYSCFHSRNGDYLERENDRGVFEVLNSVDNCSNTSLLSKNAILDLINDLENVVAEARSKRDFEVSEHFVEVIVLAKMCIWNIDELYLEISPFGFRLEHYPNDLPEGFRYNLDQIAIK